MPAPLIVAAASAVLPKLVDIGADLIERLFPDKNEADKHKLELYRLEREGQLLHLETAKQLQLAQMEINRAEAAHSSLFVSGWRPAAGWAGVIGVFWNVLMQPGLAWLSPMVGIAAPPAADIELLLFLLGGMLGLGTLRTFEKVNGVSQQ